MHWLLHSKPILQQHTNEHAILAFESTPNYNASVTIGAEMSVSLRPSEALALWHDVTLDLVRDGEHDFSSRQITILLTIYLEQPPHTVRGLAAKLKVTKPVITRALDTMGALDLVTRRRDETDLRNVIIQRTVKGALFVERIGDIIVARAKDLPR
jgi:DNA-binding MarR family transcriptional regulator